MDPINQIDGDWLIKGGSEAARAAISTYEGQEVTAAPLGGIPRARGREWVCRACGSEGWC